MKVEVTVLSVALLCAACGDKGPTAPLVQATPAPLPVLTARDGATETVVAAEISPVNPPVGTLATVRAPGFLPREARFMGDPFYLWPQDQEYVRALVYDRAAPWDRLLRWNGAFAVSSEGLDRPDVETLDEAVAEAARTSGLSITVAPTGPVTITVNPSDPYFEQNRALAYARLTARGYAIVGAEVVFAARRYVSSGRVSGRHNTMLHEIGHVLGLTHSMDLGDVMSVDDNRRSERTFGERERLALKVIYRWRTAGNMLPDAAPEARAARAGTGTFVIAE